MKKILIISLFCAFFTISCWTTETTSTKVYEWKWFKISIPSAWLETSKKDLPDVKNWTIELALTSSEISAWFSNNMVILWEDLIKDTTSTEYMNTNYIRTTGSMIDFVSLKNETIKFKDSTESKIIEFEAKYTNDTPKRKFIQTAKICNKKAYLITIWINLDNKNTSKYEDLVKSFECK